MTTLIRTAIQLALLLAITGCAHSGRLPECKGASTPINAPEPAKESRP